MTETTFKRLAARVEALANFTGSVNYWWEEVPTLVQDQVLELINVMVWDTHRLMALEVEHWNPSPNPSCSDCPEAGKETCQGTEEGRCDHLS